MCGLDHRSDIVSWFPIGSGMTTAVMLARPSNHCAGIQLHVNVQARRYQHGNSQGRWTYTFEHYRASICSLVQPCRACDRLLLFRGTEDATEFSRPLNMTLSDINIENVSSSNRWKSPRDINVTVAV